MTSVTEPEVTTPTPARTALSARASHLVGENEGPFSLLHRLAAERTDVIRLARGEPDIPTPAHIIAATKQALDGGHTGYTPPPGLIELREAIAAKLARDNDLHYDPATEIMVTTGAQEALAVTMQTLVDPGDEVLLAVPVYTAYDSNIRLAGGVPVAIPTREEEDFALSPEAIEAHITPRSKILAIVSPNNPTATIIPGETLERIAAVAQRHNLVVVADELYEKVIYDGFKHVSIATFPGMRERTIIINGFSKAYSMTGFRVGYMVGPADYMQAATEPRHSLTISTPTPSQYAAIAALNGPQDHIPAMLAEYTRRRDRMRRTFDELGVTYSMPRGGFYFYANVSGAGVDTTTFCIKAVREYGLLFYPGTMYDEYANRYIRISYLAPEAQLEEALRRFTALYRSCQAEA
ncbi:MAG: pyridoxal phosphate-dependent aminotransferase [Chloroflexi bacterium]|nr:pyridoxal phosphate-dependent aminotransferase [Chloroflexota bacterium]